MKISLRLLNLCVSACKYSEFASLSCVLCALCVSICAAGEVRDRHGLTYNLGDEGVHLVFSADSAFEGGAFALDALRDAGATASFFFTGNFLRRPANADIVRRCLAEGHYVGPHSDRHLLLADWDGERTPLVSVDSMLRDLDANYHELSRFGVHRDSARYVLPPYEWASAVHADAYRRAGYVPLGLTPGIETYADYTTPDMSYYRDSAYLWRQLCDYADSHDLRGTVIIVHLGTDDHRTDKFWRKLPEILHLFKQKSCHPEKLR